MDLSRASLAYASRKSRALGLDTIEYAEADLMRLVALGRRFDVIESSGVLHHLADPFAGWQVLLLLLKPGGMMMLGLYSAKGRRSVTHARDFIRQRHVAVDTDGIRDARQALVAAHAGNGNFASVIGSPDFFSLSACRDLLLHAQEHVLTLREITDLLARMVWLFWVSRSAVMCWQPTAGNFPPTRPAAIFANGKISKREIRIYSPVCINSGCRSPSLKARSILPIAA